ncbi:hypothetical protein H4R35_004477 [Dimargaris xerosporica]|nr:hypothetical protein H4R35_004477 [Dimargaris xerosporica]
MRRSGLQTDVLRLYRDCFRAIRAKPKESQPRFKAFVRAQFHRTSVQPRDFTTIEYLIRRGRKQLETYQNPHVHDVHG